MADPVGGDRDRVRHPELAKGHHAGQHRGHDNVDERGDTEGAQDPEGHVLLRVARLGSGGRDRLESEVRKEQNRGGPQHPLPAVGETAFVRRHERVPVVRLDGPDADGDERHEHQRLDHDQDVVDERGLRDSEHQHHANHRGGCDRDHIGAAGHQPGARTCRNFDRRADQGGGNDHTQALQETRKISRKAHREGGAGEPVLQHEQAPQRPGKNLAECGIAVGVRRA